MTKKDYILIASAINEMATHYDEGKEYATERDDSIYYSDQSSREMAMYDVATLLAIKLGKENPRFDTDKFLKACGVQN